MIFSLVKAVIDVFSRRHRGVQNLDDFAYAHNAHRQYEQALAAIDAIAIGPENSRREHSNTPPEAQHNSHSVHETRSVSPSASQSEEHVSKITNDLGTPPKKNTLSFFQFLRKHYEQEMVALVVLIGVVGVFMFSHATQRASMPVPYQGRLLDSNYAPKADGTYYFRFRITSSDGTTCYWSTGTSATNSTNCAVVTADDTSGDTTVSATVTRGLFTFLLGNGDADNKEIDSGITNNFNSGAYYLEVSACSTNSGATCELMTPRKQLGGSFYAHNADFLDALDSSSFLRSDAATTLTFTGTTTDALTITASSLTSGSGLVITGPSSGTAGVTDAILKITSDVGNIGTANGLFSLSATIDSTGASENGVNLYLSTTNSNSTNANTAYGIYNTFSDAIALGNTNYGIYTSLTNMGAISSGTKTLYGNYISAAGVGASDGTTTVYGMYISGRAVHGTDAGTLDYYGLYLANDTAGIQTNGTSTKYGLYVAQPTGADNNYAAAFAGGNVGIGDTTPSNALEVVFSSSATSSVVDANSIKIRNSDTTTNNGSFIKFDVHRTTPGQITAGAIGGTSAADTNYGQLTFYTTNAGNLTERMRIDDNGYVGIGTTPSYRLDISTATANDRGINIANTASTGTNYGIYGALSGAATTNIGAYLTATGATYDYAAIFASGDVRMDDGYFITPFGGFGRYENYLTYSEQFDNTAWTKSTNTTVPNTARTAPDGSSAADEVQFAANAATDEIYQSTGQAAASTTYTASVWLKYTSATTVRIGLRGTGGTPETTTESASVTTNWQRFTITKTFSGSATGNAEFFIDDNGNSSAVNVYVWGAQVEQQSAPAVYAQTTGAALTSTQRGLVVNSTGNVVFKSGNVGIGTLSPGTLLDLETVGTAKANTDFFEITNSRNAADMDATETSILFNQWYYDATTPAVADAGRITVGTETDWTSTASTQDAYLAFHTALDGTIAEKLRITSTGNVGIGTTTPVTNSRLAIKDGHIQIQQTTAPTTTTNANAGTGATSSVSNATDTAGKLTLTTGGGSYASGEQTKVNFNKTHTTAPIVTITPADTTTAAGMYDRRIYVTSTVNDFSLNFGVAESATTTYTFWYHALETQ